QLNEKPPGHVFESARAGEYRLTGSAVSGVPLKKIEVVINGEGARTLKPDNRRTKEGAVESGIDERLNLESSSWVAVRCFEDRADRRVRFAHTGPIHVEIAGKPLRPRKVEIDYLIGRVESEIERSKDVIPAEAIAEYREALGKYRE